MDWLSLTIQVWEKHKGKIIGVVIGLLFAICVVNYGFWPSLFILACVFLGYYIGKRADNHVNLKETIERLFPRE